MKKTLDKGLSNLVLNSIPYICFFVLMILTIMNKKDLFKDEILSYTLANNTEDMFIKYEEGCTYSPVETFFIDQITVSDISELFNFKTVWCNQSNDVHPPLYYLILHIICSLNVGKFSIWYAAWINIIFAIVTLFFFRKMMHLFVSDKKIVNIFSFLLMFSTGTLLNVAFFRMYVMAMAWVVLITYLFVRIFDEEKDSSKPWICIDLVAIASALTHYYCIIYLCAICLVFGICLLVEKRWKSMILLIGHMIGSATVSVIIFPAMIKHVFMGYRGRESINNLIQLSTVEHWQRIRRFADLINKELFGNVGITVMFMLILGLFLKRNTSGISKIKRKNILRWILAVIPAVIYFLIISYSAVYLIDRYMFPIYAVIFGMFLCFLTKLLIRIFTGGGYKKRVICYVLLPYV